MSMHRLLTALLAAATMAGPAVAAATVADPAPARTAGRMPPAPLSVPERPSRTERTVPPSAARSDRKPHPLRLDPSPALRAACSITDEDGGEDLLLSTSAAYSSASSLYYDSVALDIAANGDIYAAVVQEDSTTGTQILVAYSTDGGAVWWLWDVLSDPDPAVTFGNCGLVTADRSGFPTRVFINYRIVSGGGNGKIRVQYSDAGPAPSWTSVDVLADPGVGYGFSDLIADDETFSSYYLYLAAEARPAGVDEIVFLRSFDFGATWEAPVTIGPDLGDGHNFLPRLSYGDAGGGSATVHCTWQVTGGSSAFRYAIRHARGTGDGSSWGPVVPITSTTAPDEHFEPAIAASPTDADVVLAYAEQDTTTLARDTVLRTSTDGGVTWSAPDATTLASRVATEIRCLPDGSEFVAATLDGSCQSFALFRAPGSSPSAWGPGTKLMEEDSFLVFRPVIAPDPSRGNRWAMLRSRLTGTFTNEFKFDAEWRGDPGWPNADPGFPASLGGQTVAESAPALVDVDSDPSTLEIVFRDTAGDVRVFRSDGTELPGFPAAAGSGGPLAPVAVGDLDGDGTPEIVTSTATGDVIGMDPGGDVLFSRHFGANDSTFVTIAPLLPFSLPHLTAIVRDGVHVFTWDGTTLAQVDSVSLAGPHSQSPVSVGDVDADGRPEYVVTAGSLVHVRRLGEPADLAVTDVGHPLRQAASLADTDGDGDLEIAVPTEDGLVYLLRHDATVVTGFPRITSTASPVSAVSLARISGGPDPDLVFGTDGGALYVVTATGALASGFPVTPLGAFPILGAPVLDWVGAASPSAVVGPVGYHMSSYDAGGGVTVGWPRFHPTATYPDVSGAIADIDGDGDNEVVFVTDQVQVYDVNHPSSPNAEDRWPMAGYDPGRSGCAACPSTGSPVGVAMAGDQGAATLQLAAPFPNPSPAGFALSYALPAAAHVQLAVFDIGGRRTALLDDSRREAGRHSARWDGTDEENLRVSPGIYFVHLRADGPNGVRTSTRKVAVVR